MHFKTLRNYILNESADYSYIMWNNIKIKLEVIQIF